jgi:hypothetical protein
LESGFLPANDGKKLSDECPNARGKKISAIGDPGAFNGLKVKLLSEQKATGRLMPGTHTSD